MRNRRITALRDALVEDDSAAVAKLVRGPACGERECLDRTARELGGTAGFGSNNPDQASAAAVALVVARDHRANLVPDEDHWTMALRQAHGPGADALRLAVAGEMAKLAPRIGKTWQDEAEVTALVHDAAGVLPGACEAYVRLASDGPGVLRADVRPDGPPCVARDLQRQTGSLASGRHGVWRAAAGMQALWRDEAKALRDGAVLATGAAKTALRSRLGVIEAATASMRLP